mgnify:CR=1 FL=1
MWDLNPHELTYDPKSYASANSANPPREGATYLCTDGVANHPLVVIVTLTNNAASCTYSWTTLTSRWCNFTSEGRPRRLLIDCSCLNKHPTIVWTRSFSSPSFSLERSFAASHILRYIQVIDRSDRISGSWKSKSVYKTSMSVFYRP